MITTKNYKEKMQQLRQLKIVLPAHLEEAVIFTNTATYGGTDWDGYNSSPHIKETIDEFLMLLNRYLDDKRIDLSTLKKPKERITKNTKPLEITFIWDYLNMTGRTIKRSELKRFFENLKRVIAEKKISARSKWAKEIMELQNSIVEIYNNGKSNTVVIAIAPSVSEKLNRAITAYNRSKYSLPRSLSGIEKDSPKEVKILNSLEFASQKFKTIGFTGKWLEFFGDPAPGFTVMVYALPKKGKSYFGVDFACYLAKNFGRVLYVAREEGLDATLKKKVMDMKATHSNLDYADGLPDDLSPYSFIFLDSVTKLNLSPKDLEQIEKRNPGKSFIYIHQSTKTGNFRGANDYQHDVDMVVNFPEEGFAVQTGRYNQGGEMYIFEQPQREEPPN